MTWPNLYPIRRVLFPTLERVFPSVHFSGHIHRSEWAGVVEDVSPSAFAEHLGNRRDVYLNNCAKLKYVEGVSGERVYEQASYAHRPHGRFSTWQTHLRLFPHPQGTALAVHYETNPLTRPSEHYGGDGWSASKGVERTRKLFDLRTDIEITTQEIIDADKQ